MKIWTIANQKGGVGKTTTTVTLGGLLASAGERALLMDLDPHGSLSAYFGIDPEAEERTVYTLFQRAVDNQALAADELVANTRFDNLDVLPASTAQATLDRQLGARKGMGAVIAHGLQALVPRYDAVLLDCPPMLGVLMINALAACEHVIIPVQTEHLALNGLSRMLHTLAMIERSRQWSLPRTIVPTLYDRRTRASRHALQALQQTYAEDLWDSLIPVDTQFREASRAGTPLPMMAPNARGVLAYRALLDTLVADSHVLAECAAS